MPPSSRLPGTHAPADLTCCSLLPCQCWPKEAAGNVTPIRVNNHRKRLCKTSCCPAPRRLCCGVAVVVGKSSGSPPREQTLSLNLCADKAAGGKGPFLMGCRCQQIRSVLAACLVLDLSCCLCRCRNRGRLELPGGSERPRQGRARQKQVPHSHGGCSALA